MTADRLPALDSRQVLRALERAGFTVHHSSGSHRILKHADRPERRVTLPFHGRDLKRATLHSILRQAGLTVEEFRALL